MAIQKTTGRPSQGMAYNKIIYSSYQSFKHGKRQLTKMGITYICNYSTLTVELT